MKATVDPVVKDVVLIGGGHSHAIALRMFGMKPLAGVRLTLISEASESAYSGMLPGRVADLYSDEECHVNLCALAEFAGAQLYIDRAIALNLEAKQVYCENRPPVGFDVLSIDIGSTPSLPGLNLADWLSSINPPSIVRNRGSLVKNSVIQTKLSDRIIPAKPVRNFLDRWDDLIEQVSRNPATPMRLAIIGGGAGGVELAFNMQRRLRDTLKTTQLSLTNIEIHLIHRGDRLLSQFNDWAGKQAQQLLQQRGIHLHLNETVQTIEAGYIRCESGFELCCDYIIGVTQASAPDWLGKSGLAVDSKGFVLVNDRLQSISHPDVFAAGDIATIVDHPRPKAGVFAVRQGKPLFQNLRRFLQNKSLKGYHPQSLYLSLIGTGDEAAIAVWGPFAWRSSLLWRWKDSIDRRFMKRLNHPPEMPEPSRAKRLPLEVDHPNKHLLSEMRCAGCGSKVGSTVLERVLQRVQKESFGSSAFQPSSPDILIGLNHPDDAAVVRIPGDKLLVQTIDYFTALINDPFVFGQISANHALSDLFAMGATPQSALAIATIPYGLEPKLEETLYQLLSGAMQVLNEAGATLIGGHTTEGSELAFGLSCNGLVDEHRLLRKGGMQPQQALILTKPLGTGTLFAAKMHQKALGRWIDQAVESMLRSNQEAIACALSYGVTACTDVTGFGLLGHLVEMVRASQVAVTLELDRVPVLAGALDTLSMGLVSSLHAANLRASQWIENLAQIHPHPKFPLLFDPQTSGGLLVSVPIERAPDCIAALHQNGYSHSRVIGYTAPLDKSVLPIKILLAADE